MKRKVVSIILILSCLVTGTSNVSAMEQQSEKLNVVSSEERAISGSASASGKNNFFTIYSPGMSLVGHVDITVNNSVNGIIITIIDPNGKSICNNKHCENNKTTRIKGYNMPKGTYTIRYSSNSDSNSTLVRVTLGDF